MTRNIRFVSYALLALLALASPAWPFPNIEGSNGGGDSASTTSRPLNMPSGIQSGELLIAVTCTQVSPTHSATISGWTKIATGGDSIATPRFDVFAKIAAGSDTATLEPNGKTAHITMRISGWRGSSLDHVEASTIATGSSTTPDSSSLNPSGWDVEETKWLSVFANSNGLVGNTVSAPTSYAMVRQETATGDTSGTRCGVGVAHRNNATASEDPGAFANSRDAAWRAFTIAIRPAEAEPPPSQDCAGSRRPLTGVGC